MKTKMLFVFLCYFVTLSAQKGNYNSVDISVTPLIDGTLLKLDSLQKTPLVILIGGSGPTDRNGNQQSMENNSLRFLAEGLYSKGISSFRYDKRIVKQLKKRNLIEKDIRFDDFINDAIAIIEYFKSSGEFSNIYIIGHSQGSLVGMIAAQNRADGFVSISGAGQEIDDVIVAQLAKQAPGLEENARQAFDDLRVNGFTVNYSPGLASIFRPDIQPFILSWMQFDPKSEIAKLDIPTLIINGDRDLQVQISEAELLHNARPNSEYAIIPYMNHVLKRIEGSDMDNSKSYNQYNLPVMPELIEIISTFINK